MIVGAQVGDQRVLLLTARARGPVGPNRFAVAARQELHAPVVDRRIVHREPARRRAAVVGVDPVRLVLVPREDRVDSPWLLGQQLVEVERHPLAAQLLGDRVTDALEGVALPFGEVDARQHHVEDGVGRGIGAEFAGDHVVQIAALDVDLAAHERVVDGIEFGQFVLAHHGGKMDVAVALEPCPFVVGDVVAVTRSRSHATERT